MATRGRYGRWFLLFGSASLAAACQGQIYDPAAEETVEEPDAGVEEEAPASLTCEPASGSRLKRVLHRYADGTEVFAGFHDTELDIACEFGVASDGSMRCRPFDDALALSATLVHTDPNCTQRIAQFTYGDPAVAPRFARVSAPGSTTCDPVTWQLRLGGARTFAAGTTLYYIQDGVCRTRQAAAQARYHDVTGILQPEEMVNGTVRWVGGDRIDMRQFDGEDGSRGCDSLLLRDRGMEMSNCTLDYAEDGSMRCLPNGAIKVDSLYTDAACSAGMTVGLSYSQCGGEVRFAREALEDACQGGERLYEVGAAVEQPLYRDYGDDTCLASSSAGAYSVGQALAPTTFNAFAREWLPLGERLERGDLVSEDGLRFHRTALRDTSLGVFCAFDIAGDGATRCVPATSQTGEVLTVVPRYTDAACTAPVTVGTRVVDSCPTAPAVPSLASEFLDGRTRAFSVGEAIPGPLYTLIGTTCSPPSEGTQFFSLGAEVSPETFLSGEKVIDAGG